MAVSIDQQFVEYIVKSLVGHPDEVKVERRIDEKGVLLELEVNSEDLGRVIGKRGSTAQSLRTLLRALGTKNDARYNLKIVDTGPPPERRHSSSDNQGVSGDGRTTDDQVDETQSTAADDQSVSDDLAQADDSENTESDDMDMSEPAEEGHSDGMTEDEMVDHPDSHSDLASRTREELKELDDLDV